ncbi:MAG: hypothetical protein LBL56_05845, partial [Treponema sp.]|nr:hypothetical protein [Treponema sp.]
PAEPEILEELEVVETPEESEGLPRAKKMEEVDAMEEIKAEEGPSAGEIVTTPAVFAAGDTKEAVDREAPEDPADGPMSREDLDTLASRIEFGSTAESPAAPAGAAPLELSLFSPFDTLSFETPDFSGFEELEKTLPKAGPEAEGTAKKKRQHEAGGNSAGGLEDISEDGGQPLIYRPLLFRENGKPFILRPLAEPGGEPIHEQDGIHLINSDILDPSQETSQALDPKFLRLVESIIGRERVPHK